MAAIYACAFCYLALAYVSAHHYRVAPETCSVASQVKIMIRTLVIGLCWPKEYWVMIKNDWDNGFCDEDDD